MCQVQPVRELGGSPRSLLVLGRYTLDAVYSPHAMPTLDPKYLTDVSYS